MFPNSIFYKKEFVTTITQEQFSRSELKTGFSRTLNKVFWITVVTDSFFRNVEGAQSATFLKLDPITGVLLRILISFSDNYSVEHLKTMLLYIKVIICNLIKPSHDGYVIFSYVISCPRPIPEIHLRYGICTRQDYY